MSRATCIAITFCTKHFKYFKYVKCFRATVRMAQIQGCDVGRETRASQQFGPRGLARLPLAFDIGSAITLDIRECCVECLRSSSFVLRPSSMHGYMDQCTVVRICARRDVGRQLGSTYHRISPLSEAGRDHSLLDGGLLDGTMQTSQLIGLFIAYEVIGDGSTFRSTAKLREWSISSINATLDK
ncbi:hypothetical protein ACMFMF_009534 [Clarireedia jacksonii]